MKEIELSEKVVCEGAVGSCQLTASAESAATAELWLKGFAYGLLAFSCLQILMFPFGRDQGIYAVIANKILAGGMPYRDAWDVKPPGIFYFYALAQYVFGERMIAPRILEVVGLLSLYFPTRIIGEQLFRSRLAGSLAHPLVVFAYATADYWHTGQSESIGAILTLWAICLVVHPFPRIGKASSWGIMGLLSGFCFLLKPTLAFSAAPCAAYAAWMEWQNTREIKPALKPLAIGFAASLVPIGICALWFWLRGDWWQMIDTVFGIAMHYTGVGWNGTEGVTFAVIRNSVLALVICWLRFPTLLIIGLIAAAVARPPLMSKPGAMLIFGIVALQIVAVVLQAKFFPYHYSVAVAVCAVVAGAGVASLWDSSAKSSTLRTLLFATFMVVLGIIIPATRLDAPSLFGLPSFWRRSAVRTEWLLGLGPDTEQMEGRLYILYSTNLAEYRRVGDLVDRVTKPSDPMFVWGSESLLYWLAKRKPASRYINAYPLRWKWEQDRARENLMRDLEVSRPAIIVLEAGDGGRDLVGNSMDSEQSLRSFAQLNDYIYSRNFREIARIGNMTVFRRIDR